jgi:hypothetical protein
MMFVFGEVSDAILETTMLVEDIVRSQVIEIVRLKGLGSVGGIPITTTTTSLSTTYLDSPSSLEVP